MISLNTQRWSRFKRKLFSVTFKGIRYDMLDLFIPIWDTKTISISFWWDSLSPFIMWTLFIMFTGARQWVRHAIATARQRHPCAYHPCLTTLSHSSFFKRYVTMYHTSYFYIIYMTFSTCIWRSPQCRFDTFRFLTETIFLWNGASTILLEQIKNKVYGINFMLY